MAWLVSERSVEGRVLVIDDEEQIRKVVGTVLRKGGFDVVEAEDGAKAIEQLNSGDNPMMIDVIICDIRMPHINGTEAIKYFRAQYPSVPIIVLTAYPDFQLATSMLKEGVADYLVKPVDREKMLMAVKNAMEKRSLFAT
jgi:two-component system chemotaxis response regulator CheY